MRIDRAILTEAADLLAAALPTMSDAQRERAAAVASYFNGLPADDAAEDTETSNSVTPAGGAWQSERPAPEGFEIFAHWSKVHGGINIEMDVPEGVRVTVHFNEWEAINSISGVDANDGHFLPPSGPHNADNAILTDGLVWQGLEGLSKSDTDRLDDLLDEVGCEPAEVAAWVADGGDYAGSDGAGDRLEEWLAARG